VQTLMRELKAVGQHQDGSDFKKGSLRYQIKALMMELGQPTFFITINPADLHHPILLHFGDKEINLDEPFLLNWLTKQERCRLVADNPVASAKFFQTLVTIWLETILGVHEHPSNNERGVLGRVNGYFGTVETQGRGSLHLHMLVWIHGSLSATEISERLDSPELHPMFQHELMKYLDSVVSEEHPVHPRPPKTKCPADQHSCSARPPDPSGPDFETKFVTDLGNIVDECNIHKHTQTCYKYGHDKCRFDFERPAVEITAIKDGVVFVRRRPGHGWVNNYNDIFSVALRCNNDIKFISNGADSKALSFYITDYITKNAMSSHNVFPLLLSAIEDMEKYPMRVDPTVPTPALRPDGVSRNTTPF